MMADVLGSLTAAAEVHLSGQAVAALAPLLVLVAAFLVWCEWDLYRNGAARYLPRIAWAVIILVSIPFGAIIYLVLGRDPDARKRPGQASRHA